MTPTSNKFWKDREMDRRDGKIMTFDRALLIGIFGLGTWYGVNQLRADTLEARVTATEKFTATQAQDIVTIKIDNAKLMMQLISISNDLTRLTSSVDRMADAQAESKKR